MLKQYMLSWSECVQSFHCPVVGDHLVVRCNSHLPRECQQRLGCILNERWKMGARLSLCWQRRRATSIASMSGLVW